MTETRHRDPDPWLTAELLYIHRDSSLTDGHPDPLREWTAHSGGSDTTPVHWFAVRVWDPNGDPLLLVRELYADVPVTFLDTRTGVRSRTYGIARTDPLHLAREVWWTPSEELACAVARQVLNEERSVYRESGRHTRLKNVDLGIRRTHDYQAFSYLTAFAATVHERMPDGSAREVLAVQRAHQESVKPLTPVHDEED